MLLSSNVALFGGNSTKPGSSYYALIKAVLSLLKNSHPPHVIFMYGYIEYHGVMVILTVLE